MQGSSGQFSVPGPEVAVYVISVAAQLSGLHPQTLRTYEREGLIHPGRTGGGGRRYSHNDVALLSQIAELTGSGIGLEGGRRILELDHRVMALQQRNLELQAELASARAALRRTRSARAAAAPQNKLPVLRARQSVQVWNRPT